MNLAQQSPPIVTIVDFSIQPQQEPDLTNGFADLVGGHRPDGLLRSELLRGQGGAWRIQTTWRDRATLMALRNSGEPPAALALLDRLGVEHTHDVFTVEGSYDM